MEVRVSDSFRCLLEELNKQRCVHSPIALDLSFDFPVLLHDGFHQELSIGPDLNENRCHNPSQSQYSGGRGVSP